VVAAAAPVVAAPVVAAAAAPVVAAPVTGAPGAVVAAPVVAAAAPVVAAPVVAAAGAVVAAANAEAGEPPMEQQEQAPKVGRRVVRAVISVAGTTSSSGRRICSLEPVPGDYYPCACGCDTSYDGKFMVRCHICRTMYIRKSCAGANKWPQCGIDCRNIPRDI
jgi:hypothetical protein